MNIDFLPFVIRESVLKTIGLSLAGVLLVIFFTKETIRIVGSHPEKRWMVVLNMLIYPILILFALAVILQLKSIVIGM